MANALVEQVRKSRPAFAEGKTDAQLTAEVGQYLEQRGELDGYRKQYPDFDTDWLNIRNAGGDIGRETGAALSTFVRDRVPQVFQNIGALGADVVARYGPEFTRDPALAAGRSLRQASAENDREAQDRFQAAGGRTISRIEDIRPTNFRDYALWALPAIAENAGSSLLGLGAGAATYAATRSPGAAIKAATAAGVAQNMAEVYGSNIDGDPVKRMEAAIVGGAAAGFIDVLPQAAILTKLFPGVSKSMVAKRVSEVMGRGGLAGALQGGTVSALGEGVTEAMQEAIGIAAEEYVSGKEIDSETVRSRLMNAAATGAVIGGPIGAGAGLLKSPDAPAAPAAESATATPPSPPLAVPAVPAVPAATATPPSPPTAVPAAATPPPPAAPTPEWVSFGEEGLSIPRDQMPQIKAEARGALTNFLKAKGITSTEEEVDSKTLTPSQAEFSPKKVEAAKTFTGTDRAILVTSDDYVIDGHHQWLAKRDEGKPVRVIRLSAPFAEAIDAVKAFPSSTTAPTPTKKGRKKKEKVVEDEQLQADLEWLDQERDVGNLTAEEHAAQSQAARERAVARNSTPPTSQPAPETAPVTPATGAQATPVAPAPSPVAPAPGATPAPLTAEQEEIAKSLQFTLDMIRKVADSEALMGSPGPAIAQMNKVNEAEAALKSGDMAKAASLTLQINQGFNGFQEDDGVSLSDAQIEGLRGKTVRLTVADEAGKPIEAEVDAHEAWTESRQRMDTYRKLLDCLSGKE